MSLLPFLGNRKLISSTEQIGSCSVGQAGLVNEDGGVVVVVVAEVVFGRKLVFIKDEKRG